GANDETVRAAVFAELAKHPWCSGVTNVVVDQGVVHLWGNVGSASSREAARVAAENAAEASQDTAEAARRALEAATLAEESSARTATAARAVVEAAGIDVRGSAIDSDAADEAEQVARQIYDAAVTRAAERPTTS
ncbi:MAG: BON domain-containing protein, partial [Candidatus Limnocylindrales bacterium]